MANISITQLPAAQPLDGTELVPIVQQGVTVKTTTAAVAGSPSQQQTFLTKVQEPTLPNSRYLSTGTGLGLTDGGAQSYLRIVLNGTSASLETVGQGIIVKDSGSTVTNRAIQITNAGLAITDGDGVAGNPTLSLDGLPLALANASGTGLLAVVGGSTIAGRQILGTTSQINVANGNGSGNPTLTIADNVILPGTGALTLVKGTLAQQPVGAEGQLRFNTDTQTFDGYASGAWRQFSTAGGVTAFSAGSTGFTPVSPTSGSVTLGGILNGASGGTGVDNTGKTITLDGSLTLSGTYSLTLTQTGSTNVTLPTTGTLSTLSGSETLTNKTISGASNSLSNIGNASLTNSSVTYNGVTVALGGTGTITAANPSALTIGTGLSGGSYDGSAPITITIDSTVVTLTGTQTLTNKTLTLPSISQISNTGILTLPVSTDTLVGRATTDTLTNKSISGATNTLSNIANASLTNSAVTYNGVTVSLGASGTITASTTHALTVGTGLQLNSGTTFNGSAARTISIDSTVATLTGSQTLTNKTLTTPVIAQIVNTGTLTLPSSTDTLVGRATTDTLTNKSISGSTNTLTNIPNSALTNSSITLGTTNIALGGTSLTPAGLTSVTVTQNPTTDYQLATKQYVDNLVATGTTYHDPVYVESPDTAGNLNATYNNGVAGVGAMLTNAGTLAALTIDGVLMTVGKRVLIYNQTNQFENGVYTVTTVGSGAVAWVLTRATDADSYGPGPDALDQGSTFFVQAGNTGAGETYTCTTQGTITFGTTAITFSQIGYTQVYSAGTGLTLTSTTFSITNTGVSAATYGSASAVPVFAVNAQGQLTSVTNTSIAIAASQVTSGTLAVAQGGTNIASYTIGDLLYASGATTLSKLGIGTSTYIMTSSGSAPQWSTPSGITVGTATNAVNVGVTADSTNATRYLSFVSATTGNNPVLVDGDLTYNPSTNTLTGGTGVFTTGISGGTF